MTVSSSRSLRRALTALSVAALATTGAGCSPMGTDAASGPSGPPQSKVRVTSNVSPGDRKVAVDETVSVQAAQGKITQVSFTSAKGKKQAGEIAGNQLSWKSKQRLESGRKYVVTVHAVDDDGVAKTTRIPFQARKLKLDQQTYPSVSPLGKSTVGVAMPVSVHFDIPVKNRKLFEQHMHVTSSKGQQGSWTWISSQDAHYRPKGFWKPHQKITVRLDLNSLPAGHGVYGQMSKRETFEIGRKFVMKVSIDGHYLKAYRDGKLVNTIPVTTGEQPSYTTRSGIKVIQEKLYSTNMNSETVGISNSSSDGYNLDNVMYAQRLTNSGEFMHAAPWSVGSQGYANVSHGCTGMSTSNAAWLYSNTLIGDPVIYSGSDRGMEVDNGIGDWNRTWKRWLKGSALH